MKRLQQLFVTDRFLPHLGGSRVYYYEVARRLEIPVLTGREKGSSQFDPHQDFPIIRGRGIRPEYLGRYHPGNHYLNLLLNYITPGIIMLLRTLFCVLRYRPRVIHAGGFLFAGFCGLVVKKCFNIPYVVYAHGEELHSQKNSRKIGRYLRWIFHRADAVIASSKFTRQQLLSIKVAKERIHLVKPGVHEDFFQGPDNTGRVKKKYGLEGKLVLLSVGRLTRRKGHKQVIKALPRLLPRYPHLCFVIAGTGEEEQALKTLAREMKLDRQVIFTGRVDHGEILALYHLCDIFILANRVLENDIEGFGMVFIEAGAAGKPVIGGNSGGAVEAIQDGTTGYVVDTENIKEISGRLLGLLRDKDLRERLGRNGRLRARSFSWPVQVEKIAAVVREIKKG